LQGGLQYETKNGTGTIGYWTDPGDFPSWTFKVNQAGKFTVTTEIAALGAPTYEISAGDEKISGTAPNTGDYAKFQSTQLDGALEIPVPGEVTLRVKAVKENWSPINLASVKLTPVSAGQ
jgi:hypothetical protein